MREPDVSGRPSAFGSSRPPPPATPRAQAQRKRGEGVREVAAELVFALPPVLSGCGRVRWRSIRYGRQGWDLRSGGDRDLDTFHSLLALQLIKLCGQLPHFLRATSAGHGVLVGGYENGVEMTRQRGVGGCMVWVRGVLVGCTR